MEWNDSKLVKDALNLSGIFAHYELDDKDILAHATWGAIWSLSAIYDFWFPSDSPGAFIESLLEPIYRNEIPEMLRTHTPSKAMRDCQQFGFSKEQQWFQLLRAVACCAEALKLASTGNSNDRDMAWMYVGEAKENSSALYIESGIFAHLHPEKALPLSEFSLKGANARHTENRAIKEEFLNWYAANKDKYPSMDAAAEYAAGKVVPMKFRTVRSWISQARKKQPPGKA